MSEQRNYFGTFFHAPQCGRVEILADTLITVGSDGTIERVARAGETGHAEAIRLAERAGNLTRIPPGCFALPGFVDLHIHAPQYPQLGTALHHPLEIWLQKHTFPLEARYADTRFAALAYGALVEDLLATGTTTALMFATIHAPATKLLAELCAAKGLRALIGKVAMNDTAQCPDFYRDASVAEAVAGTVAVIDHIRGLKSDLIRPVITPRFIPSCTEPLLKELGALAQACGCYVQTHVSESDWEDGYVVDLTGKRDIDALDAHGLLGRQTVLAHGTLLTPADMEVMITRGAAVAHCPLSNVYFSNAVFPLRAALSKGLRVGLGTDISGGPSASIFDNIRMVVTASRMLEEGVDPTLPAGRRGVAASRIDWQTAFHLATAGGANALGLQVGSFTPGRTFDAMVIDTQARSGTIRLFDDVDDLSTTLQKILFSASRANVRDVYVQGRRVAGADV